MALTSAWIFFVGCNEIRSNVAHMKEPEYEEGPKALENFERGMKALFQVPQAAIVRAEKKKRKSASLEEAETCRTRTRRGVAFPPSLSFRSAAIRPCLLFRHRSAALLRFETWL